MEDREPYVVLSLALTCILIPWVGFGSLVALLQRLFARSSNEITTAVYRHLYKRFAVPFVVAVASQTKLNVPRLDMLCEIPCWLGFSTPLRRIFSARWELILLVFYRFLCTQKLLRTSSTSLYLLPFAYAHDDAVFYPWFHLNLPLMLNAYLVAMEGFFFWPLFA